MTTYTMTGPDGNDYSIDGPPGASQADVAAQMAAAHANLSAAPAPAVQGSGGQPGGWADPAGKLSAAVNTLASGASFNLAAPIMSAIGAAMPGITHSSKAPTYGQRYSEDLAVLRGNADQGQKSHPVISLAGSIAGGMLNPVSAALGAPASLGQAAAQGAGMGAAYGLGGGISDQDSAGKLALDTTIGAGLGGVAGAATHGLGLLLKGGTQTPQAQALNAAGVPTTIGQDLGGGFKRAEDAATSIPFTGDMILARQKEGLGAYNRALYNEALSPLGVTVPDAVPTGSQAVGHVMDTIGKAYDAAYNGATISKTPQFVQDIQGATLGLSRRLAPEAQAIQQDLTDRVLNSFDQNGNMDADELNGVKNWLSKQTGVTAQSTPDQRAIAEAYQNALNSVKTAIKTSDPARGALLDAADQSYAKAMPIVTAAAGNNAGKNAGIFTADQFSNALRGADDSAHKINFATKKFPVQQLTQAAQQVLPSAVADSGTGIRRLLQGMTLGAVGGGAALSLPAAATAAAPIIAGSGLYTDLGQQLAKAALFGGNPATRAALSTIPRTMLPGVLGLIGSSAPQTQP